MDLKPPSSILKVELRFGFRIFINVLLSKKSTKLVLNFYPYVESFLWSINRISAVYSLSFSVVLLNQRTTTN